ncbi:hypothetical protein BD311DRAFT_259200 [Dichomitus squalens]|uniref:Uncharacterized protein n=1 Tax=Dichomitus squalens TaxID=114155 RepID=A0A4Q9MTV5_9APHY|nr:hypothetical protein BD311DRAFT_259200 [Dichomitus squalens]
MEGTLFRHAVIQSLPLNLLAPSALSYRVGRDTSLACIRVDLKPTCVGFSGELAQIRANDPAVREVDLLASHPVRTSASR